MKKQQKKILFSANLDSFFMKFLIPQLKYFKENGYIVHVAARSQNINIPFCDKQYDVCFSRSFNLKENIQSYKQMKKIIKENQYDLISCHTPFGGAITRLAAHAIKAKARIVYMAHGFHFFEGSSQKSWFIYYPMEKILSKYTSAILTINKEDYELSKKKFNTKTYYVPGVGISKEKFDIVMTEEEKNNLKKSLGIENKKYIMIFSGEINENKNQKLLIDTVKLLKEEIEDLVLLLPGTDSINGKYQNYVKENNLEDYVKFLGYRKDIPQLLKISDISLSSSKREGLPINIIEAMYVGIPIVATACRGNRDLIQNGDNGYLVTSYEKEEFASKIKEIKENSELREKFINNAKKASEEYLLENVLDKIVRIYISDIND